MTADFRCLNCGKETERNLLPSKHVVLGAINSMNREATCCGEPEYEDLEGHYDELQKKSLRDRVPALA